MEAKAIARHLRLTPRKARLVADLVRGKNVEEALNILAFTNKKAAPLLEKVLRSAVANAVNNFDMDEESLYVSYVVVDAGPLIKRLKPRAMGRADIIHKKTSHITVVVSEKKEGVKK